MALLGVAVALAGVVRTRYKVSLLLWGLALASSCAEVDHQPGGRLEVGHRAPSIALRSSPKLESRYRALVHKAGWPRVPRYIRTRELDRRDPYRVLLTPTLQRGWPGRPVALRRETVYLYSVAVDGTFLVAEKSAFGIVSECGHPNLTGGKAARISGELNYDPKTGAFVIDNESGRYGFQLSRRPEQVAAARAMLSLIGAFAPDGSRWRLRSSWVPQGSAAPYADVESEGPLLKGWKASFSVEPRLWRRRFFEQVVKGSAAVGVKQGKPGHKPAARAGSVDASTTGRAASTTAQ